MTNILLQQWLQQVCSFPLDTLQEIAGDASFRRYFRLSHGQQSYVVMDASLQLDCCEPYFAIAKALQALGIAVPEIMAHDFKQGYMLISDFGNCMYLKALHANNADFLYKNAMNSLFLLQTCQKVEDWSLPNFDQFFMQRELDEFKQWFLEGYMKVACSVSDKKMLHTAFLKLTTAAHAQHQVFIHRDYHSANLMVIPKVGGKDQPGILDFQDACVGPITYDLVSLLRDCYIDWPEEKIYYWVNYYYDGLRERQQLLTVSLDEFKQWFDWMGIQRHLKALFIFARKYLRDHTTRYLSYLPRTLNYIVTVSERYPEFRDFHAYMKAMLEGLENRNNEFNQCVQ